MHAPLRGAVRIPSFAMWPARFDGHGSDDRVAAHIDTAAVVFDDVDSFLQKPNATDLLKELCENEASKTVHWDTDAPQLRKLIIPCEFQTESKVLLVSNDFASLKRNLAAVEDRAVLPWSS